MNGFDENTFFDLRADRNVAKLAKQLTANFNVAAPRLSFALA